MAMYFKSPRRKPQPNKALHRNAYAAPYKNYFIDRHPVNAGALGG